MAEQPGMHLDPHDLSAEVQRLREFVQQAEARAEVARRQAEARAEAARRQAEARAEVARRQAEARDADLRAQLRELQQTPGNLVTNCSVTWAMLWRTIGKRLLNDVMQTCLRICSDSWLPACVSLWSFQVI